MYGSPDVVGKTGQICRRIATIQEREYKMSITQYGITYERGDDGWLHGYDAKEDEYVMTPDNGQPDDPSEDDKDDEDDQ